LLSDDEEVEDRANFPSNVSAEECNLQEDAAELMESLGMAILLPTIVSFSQES